MSNRLFSDDKFERDFDKRWDSTMKNVRFGIFAIIAVWVVGVLLSLGVTGVLIWAIIKLVQHFCA